MPQVFKGVLVHTDSPDLTYHESVLYPDVVPLNLDFNAALSVGRAVIHRDAEAGTITLDLHIDESVEGLSSPPVALVGTHGTAVFESENGTKYAVQGSIRSATVLTASGVERMASSERRPVERLDAEQGPEEPEPEPEAV